MSLTFPTGHRPKPTDLVPVPTHGEPLRARACECGPKQMWNRETGQCLKCGLYAREIISQTWRKRAQRIARKARVLHIRFEQFYADHAAKQLANELDSASAP